MRYLTRESRQGAVEEQQNYGFSTGDLNAELRLAAIVKAADGMIEQVRDVPERFFVIPHPLATLPGAAGISTSRPAGTFLTDHFRVGNEVDLYITDPDALMVRFIWLPTDSDYVLTRLEMGTE